MGGKKGKLKKHPSDCFEESETQDDKQSEQKNTSEVNKQLGGEQRKKVKGGCFLKISGDFGSLKTCIRIPHPDIEVKEWAFEKSSL